MDDQFAGIALLTVQFTAISFTLQFAWNNIKGVVLSKDRADDVMLALGVLICFGLDLELLHGLIGLEPEPGPILGYTFFQIVDFVITGAAMAGGPGKYISGLKEVMVETKKDVNE